MASQLQGRKIAFIAADGVEQVELTDPWKAVEHAGGHPELISISIGEIQAVKGMDKADTFQVDRTAEQVDARDYAGLVIPGGVKNPDKLRADDDVVRFVRDFFEAGKPVGAICHGPWVLVEAGVVAGRTLTSYPSISTDIRNAGGNWVDEECHVDAGLVTSRKPDDLPAFCSKIVEEFAEGRHDEQASKTAQARA